MGEDVAGSGGDNALAGEFGLNGQFAGSEGAGSGAQRVQPGEISLLAGRQREVVGHALQQAVILVPRRRRVCRQEVFEFAGTDGQDADMIKRNGGVGSGRGLFREGSGDVGDTVYGSQFTF